MVVGSMSGLARGAQAVSAGALQAGDVAGKLAPLQQGRLADAVRGARIAVVEHPTTHRAATTVSESLGRLGGDVGAAAELIDGRALARLAAERAGTPGAAPRFDAVITYTGAMIDDQGLAALQALRRDPAVAVLNGADAITVSRDKLLSFREFATHGVATPRTVTMQGLDDAARGVDQVGLPAVIKLPVGTEGQEVAFVRSADEARSFMREVAPDELWLAQETIRPVGQDIRAVVVREPDGAHRLVASMQRTGEGFHANISQGGSGRPIELDAVDATTAIRATQSLGLDFGGVDLMGSPGAMQVIEVNSGLGLTIERVTGAPISEHIAATALHDAARARMLRGLA